MKQKVFLILVAGFMLFSGAVQAQDKKYPEQEPMTHAMSEFWLPRPNAVTPGSIVTNTAPSDAIVLFNGKDLSAWQNMKGEAARWDVHHGVMTVVREAGSIRTKEEFGSFQLHLEWYVPRAASGEKQSRGNSGVYLQGIYELQIIDDYSEETYANGMAASIYKQTAPLVSPIRKPGEWNVYDIIYTAPVFKEDGTYLYRPRVTVLFNGVLVQNNTEIRGTTPYVGFPRVVKHGDGPIMLQSHGNPVSFRNIWIRRL